MYADYDFYVNEYYGNVISETDFPRLEQRASYKLDYICMGRIEALYEDGCDNEKLLKKINMAICKIAELLKDIEDAEMAYRDSIGYEKGADGLVKGKTVASISAGAESISFNNSTVQQSSLVSAVLTDKKAQDKLFFESAREYLGNTGLLSQVLE